MLDREKPESSEEGADADADAGAGADADPVGDDVLPPSSADGRESSEEEEEETCSVGGYDASTAVAEAAPEAPAAATGARKVCGETGARLSGQWWMCTATGRSAAARTDASGALLRSSRMRRESFSPSEA
jgi:hypothetical protein